MAGLQTEVRVDDMNFVAGTFRIIRGEELIPKSRREISFKESRMAAAAGPKDTKILRVRDTTLRASGLFYNVHKPNDILSIRRPLTNGEAEQALGVITSDGDGVCAIWNRKGRALSG